MTRWTGGTKKRFLHVNSVPAHPKLGASYWIDALEPPLDYTHPLFRYPAKFYRPVINWALSKQTSKRHTVLDPFAGSGTLNLEALLSGRPSFGIDLDPLACFIAQAKTTVLDPDRLDKSLERIKGNVAKITRKETELERLIGSDISREQYERGKSKFWIPTIPNIEHWFKRHVILDLSALLNLLKNDVRLEKAERHFFLACYASIIRRVSNADPTPVSGLEVTKIQAKRNETREINVMEYFLRKSRLGIHGMRELWSAVNSRKRQVVSQIVCGDARDIEGTVVNCSPELLPFSLAITSPPYCNAVEYGRRHKLEMFWLNLVPDTNSHSALSRSYIGYRNPGGRRSNRLRGFGISKLDRVLKRIGEVSFVRALALERYFSSMQKSLYELARVTERNADFICVIGDSTCAGVDVPTATIVSELASEQFILKSKFSYAIRNHHMQYGLRNGNGIREDVVLAFQRR
jgi:hypothetical protein